MGCVDPKLKNLTPKEREIVMLIKQRIIKEREIEFYSIHGGKSGKKQIRNV